ncbi:acyltransferase family protein [Methylobacterium mesophilicum]
MATDPNISSVENTENSSSKSDIPALTGLRGVAACWVVLYHLHDRGLEGHLLRPLISKGYIAVDMFFILSGFLMTYLYSDRLKSGVFSFSHIEFLTRRFARIYPLYILVTVSAYLIFFNNPAFALKPDHGALKFLTNIFMIQAWGLTDSVVPAAWSVSTECFAYFIFPVLLIIVPRTGSQVALAATVSLTFLFLISNGPAPVGVEKNGPLDLYWPYPPYALIRCLIGFYLGVICTKLIVFSQFKKLADTLFFQLFLTILIICSIYYSADLDVLLVFYFFLLISILAASVRGPLPAIFSSPFAIVLGQISYALYLTHGNMWRIRSYVEVSARSWLDEDAIEVVAVVVMYIAAMFVAVMTHKLFELPSRRAILSLLSRRMQR